MKIGIGGDDYTLTRLNYVERSNSECKIKIAALEGFDIFILGLNFFHNYYTVFDPDNNRIGFAKSIHFVTPTSNLIPDWMDVPLLSGFVLLICYLADRYMLTKSQSGGQVRGSRFLRV